MRILFGDFLTFPVARHVNAASSPSCTATSDDESSVIISGDTKKFVYEYDIYVFKKKEMKKKSLHPYRYVTFIFMYRFVVRIECCIHINTHIIPLYVDIIM